MSLATDLYSPNIQAAAEQYMIQFLQVSTLSCCSLLSQVCLAGTFVLYCAHLHNLVLFLSTTHAMSQGPGEIVFVPSGWWHQVENVTDALSINHNWVNAANIHYSWCLLQVFTHYCTSLACLSLILLLSRYTYKGFCSFGYIDRKIIADVLESEYCRKRGIRLQRNCH